MFNRKGFTLVELMIVVAIIGILAAIAIPNFISMQHRAKRAEVPANVDGIKTAELAYDASFDTFVSAEAAPRSTPTKESVAWVATEGFTTLGWGPDGNVRGVYSVTVPTDTDFKVTGTSDVDGDGSELPVYTSTKSLNAALTATEMEAYY